MTALKFWTFAALVAGGLLIWVATGGPPPPVIETAGRDVAALLKAAGAGDVAAQREAGRRLLAGDGVAADPAEAFKWLSEAARQGDAPALALLGRMHEDGRGVKRDFARAAEHYRAALRRAEDAEAAFRLGAMALAGRGVANDLAEAARLFALAAAKGHPAARHFMGVMAEEGWQGPPDPAQAYYWYSLAMRNAADVKAVDGRLDPARARANLAPRMLRYQVENAERRLAAEGGPGSGKR